MIEFFVLSDLGINEADQQISSSRESWHKMVYQIYSVRFGFLTMPIQRE